MTGREGARSFWIHCVLLQAGLGLAATGCGRCPYEHFETYQLAGTVPAPSEPLYPLRLRFMESASYHLGEECRVDTPGGLVLDMPVSAPGGWSANVEVTYGDNPKPSVDIFAYWDARVNGYYDGDRDVCFAYAVGVPPGDHTDVALVAGPCPSRQ